MEDRDLCRNHQEAEVKREPYETPEAKVVRVEHQARVVGCNFSTIQVCGIME
jgi:hypothetical protein